MSEIPRNKPPVRSVSTTRPPSQRTGSGPSRNVPAKRDPFPFVIGGLMGALVVGLALVVFLLANNSGRGTTTGNPTSVGILPGGAQATVGIPSSQPTVLGTAEPTVEPAPRMPMEAFKALYDDPSKRPMIIDVRAKTFYDQGHIPGAISFPESDVDTHVAEIPKDKLVIAYCQ